MKFSDIGEISAITVKFQNLPEIFHKFHELVRIPENSSRHFSVIDGTILKVLRFPWVPRVFFIVWGLSWVLGGARDTDTCIKFTELL